MEVSGVGRVGKSEFKMQLGTYAAWITSVTAMADVGRGHKVVF